MSSCEKCGAQNTADALFCGACGATLKAPFEIQSTSAVAHGPDREGNISFECSASIVYDGALPVPFAKIQMIVSCTTVNGPIILCGSETYQRQLSDDLEAGDFVKLDGYDSASVPDGVDSNEFFIKPSIALYPVQWREVDALDLPVAVTRVSMGDASSDGLHLSAWMIPPQKNDEAEYLVRALVTNRSLRALPMVAVRVVIVGRKGQQWVVTTSILEHMAPGEERVVDLRSQVDKNVHARKGARAQILLGACERAIVCPLPSQTPEILPVDEGEDDYDWRQLAISEHESIDRAREEFIQKLTTIADSMVEQILNKGWNVNR